MRKMFEKPGLRPRDASSFLVTGLTVIGTFALTLLTGLFVVGAITAMSYSANAADWEVPRLETAKSDSGFYVGVGGGAQWLADVDIGGGVRDEIGGLGAAQVGYDLGMFRAEIEATVGYNALDIGGADINVWTPGVFANAFIDLENSTDLTPYIGAGAGMTLIAVGPISETAFAWQGMAGVTIDLTETTALSVGYRFRRYEDVTVAGASLGHVDSHNAEIGFRFRF